MFGKIFLLLHLARLGVAWAGLVIKILSSLCALRSSKQLISSLERKKKHLRLWDSFFCLEQAY